MDNARWLEQDEIGDLNNNKPHIVLLGAGASLAAFPDGERNGKRLPLMKTLVDVVGLAKALSAAGIEEPYDDFEAVYSDITANPSLKALKLEIEERVASYFSSLKLPNYPTLYDHLVLSLRPKDVIATFNWDPFLCMAAKRNSTFGGGECGQKGVRTKSWTRKTEKGGRPCIQERKELGYPDGRRASRSTFRQRRSLPPARLAFAHGGRRSAPFDVQWRIFYNRSWQGEECA